MLERIEITGFEIIGKTVVTKFQINKIATTSVGSATAISIMRAISDDGFRAAVLAHTVTAITTISSNNTWTPDSIFPSAPTDDQGVSATSLFAGHDGNANVTAAVDREVVPPAAFTSISSEY